MKTDSIFFRIFQTLPQLFFEILGEPAERGDYYEFTSVEVKQTAFRIDGVFLPKPDAPENTVIFVEFQFQQDEVFYERFSSEILLYLRQNRSFDNWRAIAVYPRHSTEQTSYDCHRFFVESEHFQRLYLEDFLGESSEAIGIQLMQLIVSPKKDTDRYLEGLVAQLQNETIPQRQDIIELITTVMVYKFQNLTREEIESMFTVSDVKQTKVYQEAFEEGIEEGIEQGLTQGIEQGREEGITEGMRNALSEALERERLFVLRLLTRKVGEVPSALVDSIKSLSFEQLEILGEALLDFEQLSDLEIWLQQLDENPEKEQEQSPNQ